jgi:S-adenosylmethionine/arginine decarboxylase-like enzyme
MASIEEEAAKRYELMKKTSPWTAIDYLEAQLAAKDARIAELERELTNWPIEYEDE